MGASHLFWCNIAVPPSFLVFGVEHSAPMKNKNVSPDRSSLLGCRHFDRNHTSGTFSHLAPCFPTTVLCLCVCVCVRVDDCSGPEGQPEEAQQQHGLPHQTLTEAVQGNACTRTQTLP